MTTKGKEARKLRVDGKTILLIVIIIVSIVPLVQIAGASYSFDGVPYPDKLDLVTHGTFKGGVYVGDDEIVKLGYLLEREEEAQDFIDRRQERIATIKSAVDGLERPKVYIEKDSSTGTGELGTYGEGSAFDMLCEMAGGENVATHMDTLYPKVNWEWVIEQNPDIIIKEEPRTFLGVTSKAEDITIYK